MTVMVSYLNPVRSCNGTLSLREHLQRLIAEEKPSGKSMRDTIIVPSMQAKPANKQIFTS